MKGISIVTGTKNDSELIEFFIHHHLRLGFKKLHIMDFNSTDGTRDILKKYTNHPQLDIILSDHDHGKPVLHQWLRLRAYLDDSTDHIIYLDADEMMVLQPNTSINDVIIAQPNIVNRFPRYNIVNPVALKEGLSERLLLNLHRMYFHTPTLHYNQPIQPEKEWIEWIKLPIAEKVLHAKIPVRISLGGHYAIGPQIDTSYSSGKAFIAHFPVTTYKRMVNKIISLKSLIKENPHWNHIFIRYIRICYVYDQGLGEDMFKEVYLGKEAIQARLLTAEISHAKKLLTQSPNSVDISTEDISTYPGGHYGISREMAHEVLTENPEV